MIDYVNNLNVRIGEPRRMICRNCNGYKSFSAFNITSGPIPFGSPMVIPIFVEAF